MISIFLACFFVVVMNISPIWGTDNHFQIFNNTYKTLDDFLSEEKSEWQKEDLTIPKSLFEKRSKIVDAIIESKDKRRYAIKKNTLLSIDTKDIFPNSFIFHRNRIYRTPYYIFVKQGDEKIEVINRSLALKNMDASKVMTIRIVTDETAPVINLIPLEKHEQKEGAIIFGKNITLLVKITDELAHLKNIVIKEDSKILVEKAINQKNIFLQNITLSAENEKNLSLSIDASDQLGNTVQKNFSLQSIQRKPKIKIFLKEGMTFSKIHKNDLDVYTIKIDDDQEHIILFETEPQNASIYVLLEKMESRQRASLRKTSFQKMNSDEGIRLDQAGDLYFYAEDQFGNKSEVEYLKVTKDIQKKVSIEVQ